jgi:hypothetical protein
MYEINIDLEKDTVSMICYPKVLRAEDSFYRKKEALSRFKLNLACHYP